MTEEQLLLEFTKTYWKSYLLDPANENLETLVHYLAPESIMIGTGKSEFFTNIEQILIVHDQMKTISFEIFDYWQGSLKATEDVCLVYGGFRAVQSISPQVKIEMDTRFSVLYQKKNDEWKIFHIHHSVPSSEQEEGEYYPETLSEQTKIALEKATLYKEKSEIDDMTGLYNNETFKFHISEHLKKSDHGTLFLFDIDFFKEINDSYGHLIGDEVLKLFSRLLQHFFDFNSIWGRMGGDEFFAFEASPPSREITIEKIKAFQNRFNEDSKLLLKGNTVGFSVGIVSLTKMDSFCENLIHKADIALYSAKNMGRHIYHWYNG